MIKGLKKLFIFTLLVIVVVFLVSCDEDTITKDPYKIIFDKIEIKYFEGDNFLQVTNDVNLPLTVETNIKYDYIGWTSSKPYVIDTTGKVYRQDEDEEVVLVVTLIIDGVGKEKIFYLTVIGTKDKDGVYHKITFNSKGGTVINDVEIKDGNKVTRPIDPIRNGYDFIGWFLGDNYFDFNTPIHQPLTITAKWVIKEDVKKVVVSFNTDGGSKLNQITVANNSTIDEIDIIPTRDNDTFLGWYKDFELTSPWNFNEDIITTDITLYAKWSLTTIPYISNRTLVFSDEFDGNELDKDYWSFQNGTGREYGLWWWGNEEKQLYQEENTKVSDGTLKIYAKQERVYDKASNATMNYTSSKIVTKDKFYRTYGRFEIRMKAPVGNGFWPAFWLMPQNNSYGNGWPHNGEIDIVELRGRKPNEVTSAFHFANKNGGHQYLHGSTNLQNNKSIDEFNVYALDWSEGRLDFSVNGYVYHSRTNAWYNSPKPFNHDFYIIINLAIGGTFDGGVLPSLSDFPAKLEVDYVRVYA